jgi:hypothetical protein
VRRGAEEDGEKRNTKNDWQEQQGLGFQGLQQ